MDIKVAVAYHKKSPRLESDVFIPVHAGSAESSITLDMTRDDSGDNISDLNYTYSEMTVAYWLWKNTEADVKGLFHYRRILGMDNSLLSRIKYSYHKFRHHLLYPSKNCGWQCFSDQALQLGKNLPSLMEEHDVLVPRPMLFAYPVERSFLFLGHYFLKLLESSLARLYPDYSGTLEKTLSGREMYSANIVIMRDEIYDRYCEFIFKTLEDVRNRVVSDGWLLDPKREKAFSRRMGYLAELLTNTFVVYGRENLGLRVRELPSYYLAE